jgi:hypothetical protein
VLEVDLLDLGSNSVVEVLGITGRSVDWCLEGDAGDCEVLLGRNGESQMAADVALALGYAWT